MEIFSQKQIMKGRVCGGLLIVFVAVNGMFLVMRAEAQECIDTNGNGVLPPPCGADCRDVTADRDGDGHLAIVRIDGVNVCGDDCDDSDSTRFPGNTEVCDPRGHDEDCDPQTYGTRDRDGDGYVDWNCVNFETTGDVSATGSDCDDLNNAIFPGQQFCLTQTSVMVCGEDVYICSQGCVEQPNGTGICMGRPISSQLEFENPTIPGQIIERPRREIISPAGAPSLNGPDTGTATTSPSISPTHR